MKLFFLNLLVVFFTALFISCNVEGEERLDYYKNQHRSPELMGWWKRINYLDVPEKPPYYHFTNFKRFSYQFNSATGIYSEGFDYWYNDATTIYLLDAPSPIAGVSEISFEYSLNSNKDTLTINEANPPTIYVKSQGL